MKALKCKPSAQHDSAVSIVLSLRGCQSLKVVTADKGRVLLIVGYHYLIYSQAAPEFIQHLRLMKLSYNYVMQPMHNVLVVQLQHILCRYSPFILALLSWRYM